LSGGEPGKQIGRGGKGKKRKKRENNLFAQNMGGESGKKGWQSIAIQTSKGGVGRR